MPPPLSVIVCSHNGASTIARTLDSLAQQTLDDVEVIVIDDGSTDGTAGIAAAHGVAVHSLFPSAGLAGARNAGIRAARAPLIAFTDDDCEVDADWARAVVTTFDDPCVDGVSGPVIPQCESAFVRGFLQANNPIQPLPATLLEPRGPLYRLLLYIRSQVRPAPMTPILYSVVGANMAFRASALTDVDGFDEAFRFGSEEEDLSRRLHDRPSGATLRYAADAQVAHWFDSRISDGLRRSRSYGRGNARTMLKQKRRRPIVFPVPLATSAAIATGLLTRRPGFILGGLLAPLLGYPGWLGHARRRRSLAPVAYPYISLAQESFTMLGQVDGIRAGYQPVPSAHLVRPGDG
jgi:glycosyltransferase involved in cell wall biosynthesis